MNTDPRDTPPTDQSASAFEDDDAPSTRVESPSSEPDDITPPLAAMFASIRSAVTPNASAQARTAGASACRSILAVLEAKPGQTLSLAPPSPTQPQSPLASLLSQPGLLTQLATMSREQLLDLLRKVSGAGSPRTQSPAASAPRFHLIQIPQVRRPGGGS